MDRNNPTLNNSWMNLDGTPTAAEYSFRRLQASQANPVNRPFFNGNVYYDVEGPRLASKWGLAGNGVGRFSAGADNHDVHGFNQQHSDPTSNFRSQRLREQRPQPAIPQEVWNELHQRRDYRGPAMAGGQQSLLGPPPPAPPPTPHFHPAAFMQPPQAAPFGFGGPGPYPPFVPQGGPMMPGFPVGAMPPPFMAPPMDPFAPPFLMDASRHPIPGFPHPGLPCASPRVGGGGGGGGPGLLGPGPSSVGAAMAAQAMAGRLMGGSKMVNNPRAGVQGFRPPSLVPGLGVGRRRRFVGFSNHPNQMQRFTGNGRNHSGVPEAVPSVGPPALRPGGQMAPYGRRRQTSNQALDAVPTLVHHGAYPVFTPSPLMRRPFGQVGDGSWGIGRGWPYVTARGTIALRLSGHIMVEMTCDEAIRVVNYEHNILLTVDQSGMCAALVHPTGRMHQHNARVEVVVYEPDGNHKFAKMWYKGVSFTSERSALVYLVDEGGTRTTADRFSPQLHAPSFATASVFLHGAIHASERAFHECYKILQDRYDFFKTKNGADVWVIGNIRISQTNDCVVMVTRDSREQGQLVKRKLKTSSRNGCALLSTPMVHATASMGQNPHLYVRRGERRVHKDERCLIVRNGSHSAGFDERGRLKVF